MSSKRGLSGAHRKDASKRSPVIVVASPGGHFKQAMIMTETMGDRVFVSYPPANMYKSSNDEPLEIIEAREVRYGILGHALNAAKFLIQFLRVRPKAIISTGGPFCLSMFLVARALRIKCIYVDTLSRVEDVSNTCKLVARLKLADEVYTQWPHLDGKRKGVRFNGSILNLRYGGDSR